MKLNNFKVDKTGTLIELLEFENQLNTQNKYQEKLFNLAVSKEKTQNEEQKKQDISQGRFYAFGAAIISIIFFIFIFVEHSNKTAPPVNPIIDTAKMDSQVIYYVKTHRASLLSAKKHGKIIYSVPRGTALAVIDIQAPYFTVTYNGSTLYVNSNRLSVDPPSTTIPVHPK